MVCKWDYQLKRLTAHIGYFIPLLKFADFLAAGIEVSLLYFSVLHHDRIPVTN